MLTEEDIEIKNRYLAMDEADKEKYLEETGIVILDIRKGKDGFVEWEIELSETYKKCISDTQKPDETFESACNRFISEALEFGLKNDKETN